MTRRPQPNEFGPYFNTYISKVETGDIVQLLTERQHSTLGFLKKIPEAKWDYRYAEGKWSIKEVLLHVIDGERVFAYRALRIARGDKTPLASFDENLLAANCHADSRTPDSLMAEYEAVSNATIHLFRHLTDDDLGQIGTASGQPASPLALGYIIAGHEKHHLGIIRERYL
ncbi:MAG: DinB family protein [Bacteroidetes bacterium]|nr:DinB family protein [Bacteroidota bacterium]